MQTPVVDFTGKRIVVVEDDYLLARDICRDLRAMGATVLGPAPTPFYALQLIGPKNRRKIDAAVLDVRLHGATIFEMAEELQERGIPFVFATGEEKGRLPERFSAAPVVQKPFVSTKLAQELQTILRKRHVYRPAPPPPRPLFTAYKPTAIHFARALAKSWLV